MENIFLKKVHARKLRVVTKIKGVRNCPVYPIKQQELDVNSINILQILCFRAMKWNTQVKGIHMIRTPRSFCVISIHFMRIHIKLIDCIEVD